MGLLDTAYDELRKPRAMGMRVGDFVPYVPINSLIYAGLLEP